MSIKIEISFSISRDRLETLYNLYTWIIEEFKPTNPLEYLTHAHAKEMHWRLEVILTRRRFKNMTFILSETEAISYCWLWKDWSIQDPFAKIIIDKIFDVIHQQSSAPQFTQNGQNNNHRHQHNTHRNMRL